MNSRGFTLVEVLVALAIVATALLACLRAVGEMAASSKELELRLLADLSANNAIAAARAAQTFPPIRVQRYPCPQGNLDLVCRQSVTATPNPLFRRLEVRVHLKGESDHYYAEVVGIVGDLGGQ